MAEGTADSDQRGRTTAIVLLVIGFIVGVIALGPSDGPRDGVRRVLGVAGDRPLPKVDPPGDSGEYAFMQTTDSGEPVAFDPCTPVAIRINPERAPEGSAALIETAAARLSQASGILLTMGDETDARPQLGVVGELEQREQVAPTSDPEIVVMWSRPRETSSLRGKTVGVGGSTAYSVGDARPYYLRGAIALDTRPLREALLRSDGPRRITAVAMHEIGHALGLDHVKSDSELMNARSLGRLELGPGDRTGLALLGGVPCSP